MKFLPPNDINRGLRLYVKDAKVMNILDFIKSQDSRPETMNVTPHWISELKDDEIFVFGCRRSGRHYEGAANFAREKFGAIVGQGEGLQGQSDAIPIAGVGLGWIRHAVNRFTEFASANPDLKFLVTPIGCGLGLWDYDEIALYSEKHQNFPMYGCRKIFGT